MKHLLAVVSCHTRPEFSDTIRNTWAPIVPTGMDLVFFKGRGNSLLLQDEVSLDCKDTKEGLPEKVRAIFLWALENKYDLVTKLDDDVVLDPKVFSKQDFSHEFMGSGKTPDGTKERLAMPYGFCYTLSKIAMQVIAAQPLPRNNSEYEHRHDHNDEYWVSWCLHRIGVYLRVNWLCSLWDGTDLYPELPGTFIFCVHMHDSMSRPQEVHEMCRIWRDRLSGPNE